MASFFRFASRTAPAMAATALASSASSRFIVSPDHGNTRALASCEAPALKPSTAATTQKTPANAPKKEKEFSHAPKPLKKPGFHPDAEGFFYGMIPMRQLYTPKMPWPMWDVDWDSKEPKPSGNDKLDRRRKRYLRKYGVTRHIILIRHAQYDETHKEDEKRILTEMGRKQAHETGKRIAQMIQGTQGDPSSPCTVKLVRVSGLTRAQETANIIASYLPQVERVEPDPLLNETRPCHTIPSGGRVGESIIQKTEEGHLRAEEAFQKFFSRAEEIEYPPDEDFLDDDSKIHPPEGDSIETRHEYEIIVGHANVIRYFFCRALQLPPEAWLRLCTFNCSLTYLTIRPTGSVSCRMLGDVGHLPPELVSFSGHHGFNW